MNAADEIVLLGATGWRATVPLDHQVVISHNRLIATIDAAHGGKRNWESVRIDKAGLVFSDERNGRWPEPSTAAGCCAGVNVLTTRPGEDPYEWHRATIVVAHGERLVEDRTSALAVGLRAFRGRGPMPARLHRVTSDGHVWVYADSDRPDGDQRLRLAGRVELVTVGAAPPNVDLMIELKPGEWRTARLA